MAATNGKLLLLVLLLSTAGCEAEHRRPANVYIPNGYVGWVRIEYEVKGAPELERDFFGPWEYQRFPKSGLLRTSSKLNDGAASVNYFYYSDGGEKSLPYEMVNGGIISWCVKKLDHSYFERDFLTFFVGPKEEYEKHKHELERFRKGDCVYVVNSLDDLPKVGNLSRQ
ncbi:MAG TPA: hypothetical protein VKB05_05895 [Pyrinomonadaceae bacterium]|nr:hypothetical protein [Pyrinomonadaceae bacterium]